LSWCFSFLSSVSPVVIPAFIEFIFSEFVYPPLCSKLHPKPFSYSMKVMQMLFALNRSERLFMVSAIFDAKLFQYFFCSHAHFKVLSKCASLVFSVFYF